MKRLLSVIFLMGLLMTAAAPAGAIDCRVIVTNDYSILDKFYKTSAEAIPVFTTTNSVLAKEYFTVHLFLTDYQTDQNKFASANYDIRVIAPDGKVYFEKQNLQALNTRVPKPNNILLSQDYLKMCFEPADQFGDYTIEIQLRDNISQTSKDFKYKLRLVNFEYKQQFDGQSLVKWMSNYHSDPSPEKAIAAFIFYFSQSEANEKSTSFLPALSFFLEIFNNNPYLIPHLVNLYESQDLRTKKYIIYLLRYSNQGVGDLINKMGPEERELYQKILTENLPDPYGEMKHAGQLDMLWGIFLASGSYKPVLKIVNTLELRKYRGYVEKYKTSTKTEEDRIKAFYDACYRAAQWSLKSNCSQYHLVRDYCIYIYENEKISTTVRSELREVLSK